MVVDLRGCSFAATTTTAASLVWPNHALDASPAFTVDSHVASAFNFTENAFHFGDGNTVISGTISTNPSAMQAASYEVWVKVEEYSGSNGWVVSQYLLLNHPLRWTIS